MQKSTHNHTISSDIPVRELTNFINPVNMTLFVPRGDISSVFKNWQDIREYLLGFYEEIFTLIPSYPPEKVKEFTRNSSGITYTPHTDGYDFRFHPIDFINKLFESMGIEHRINFINLDNEDGMNYLKDYVRAYINDYKINKDNQVKPEYDSNMRVLEEVNKNLDSILAMYKTDLTSLIYHEVIPKDMLLYLAYKSLLKFEETKEEVYLILPYEYYVNILPMQNSPYPHRLYVGYNRIWYDDFGVKYRSLYDPAIVVDDNKHILNNHELLLAWDILRPGELDRVIRNTCQYTRAKADVDYDKYLDLFEQKMNYYMHSSYVRYIQGKYGLSGYIGFSYPNEYLVFDKFHNSDTIDSSRRTILTHSEAIFALPSDRFGIVRGTKQDIIEAKETDDRIKKVNHTDTFTRRLDTIIHGPNVSTSTFDKVIEQEKKRILIRN